MSIMTVFLLWHEDFFRELLYDSDGESKFKGFGWSVYDDQQQENIIVGCLGTMTPLNLVSQVHLVFCFTLNEIYLEFNAAKSNWLTDTECKTVHFSCSCCRFNILWI